MTVNSYGLLDELRAEEYNKAKQADASCFLCLFFLPSSKFSPYCKLKRKYVHHYNFCNSFNKKEEYESKGTPTKETTRETTREESYELIAKFDPI